MKDKKKSWFRRHWILSSILVFFLLVVIVGIIGDSNQGISDNSQTESLPASYDEAMQEAINVSYENLMRNAESYTSEWICFKGQVIQVVSDIPKLELRVATKKEAWVGYMEDEIYLYSKDYSGERLLEDDLIQFCGKSAGILTYDTIMGNTISIPGIETDDLYVKRIS